MPRIKTTRTVTIALYLLRIYLLAMLLIILTKFVIEARGRRGRDASPPAARGKLRLRRANHPQIPFSQLRRGLQSKTRGTRSNSHAKAQGLRKRAMKNGGRLNF